MTTPLRTDARMTRPPARRFLAALAGGPLDDRPDAELLDRFARYGERPALEAVVRRHGPLVRGVCRRHLGSTPDADDAFQATFLVLLRHTGRGRPPARVGPWLYAVAVRTSARLRSRRRLAPLPEVVPDRTPDPSPAADWVPVLDRELAGLPAKYRDALVLCELQGRSRREAATLLGIAEGTLSSRLARGRDLLRRRLLKHGTLLPAAGLGTLVAGEAATAEAVAATLALADGAVPATVAAAVPPAGWGVWKLAACVGLVAVGGLAVRPGDEPPKADAPAKPAAVAVTEPARPAVPAVPDREALQGLWLFDDIPLSEAGRKKLTGGDKVPPADLDAMLAAFKGRPGLVLAGDRWWEMNLSGSEARPYDLRLSPDRNPKWLDRRLTTALSPARVNSDDTPVRGIYGLAGDRLTVADSRQGGPRPADLGPTDDVDRKLTVVYRKAPPPTPEKLTAAKPLLGRWELVGGQHNIGSDGSVRPVTDGWLEVTPYALFLRWGDKGSKQFTAAQGGPLAQAATYELDTTKRHPWIDLAVLTELDDKHKPVDARRYGVYELTGDTLRLVFGRDKAFRPLDFAVEPNPTKPGQATGPDLQTECLEFKRAPDRSPDRE